MAEVTETYWIRTKQGKTHYKYTCTNCHMSVRFNRYTFCPNCGRRMVSDILLNEKGDVI